MSEIKYTTEYLIIHEEEIDWDELSAYSEKVFTLTEIRLFRRKINWLLYLMHHKDCFAREIEIEMASKYFSKPSWFLLLTKYTVSEEFLEKHKDEINWRNVLAHQPVSETFLMEHCNYWNIYSNDIIVESLLMNPNVDSANWNVLHLYLKLKN